MKQPAHLFKTIFLIICFVLVAAERFFLRHSHFGDGAIDGVFAFYALSAVIISVLFVLFIKCLSFLKVKENFYDDSL